MASLNERAARSPSLPATIKTLIGKTKMFVNDISMAVNLRSAYMIRGWATTVIDHETESYLTVDVLREAVSDEGHIQRQIKYELQRYERAKARADAGDKTQGPESWQDIARTAKRMMESRQKQLERYNALIVEIESILDFSDSGLRELVTLAQSCADQSATDEGLKNCETIARARKFLGM